MLNLLSGLKVFNRNKLNGAIIMAAVATGLSSLSVKADPVPGFPEWKEPDLVTITPGAAFVPTGFDDNDRTQLVIAGALRNTCYKIGPTDVKIDRAAKKIIVSQKAYYYTGCWCLQMLIPFQQTVEVGVLPPGNYSVQFLDAQGVPKSMGMLSVARAGSPAPDDFLYAPVSEGSVELLPGTVPVLTLAGTFASNCLFVKEVKILNRAPYVIEVLPIVEVKAGMECHESPTPFIVRAKLDRLSYPLRGKNLIHIRSLNGQALNKLVDF